ncbi:hypothetical protein B0T17DRAFT_526763 [Bombardia bombarda]|uniref:GPI ethanolamine phosphate transferase 2 n=1 Tax=Bombardia bombarda TaxID=252184 RepID=A0AA40C9C3_9PEZI|nr:hypothetical protein B0T17DRAFT_526763 [Bombardia bombarda]
MTSRRRCEGEARDGTIISTLLLIAANVLIPISLLIFATGFFPYKPLLAGLAEYGTLAGYGDPPQSLHLTSCLIRDGAAMPFTAHATSPTVTMPRLKAITTGSVPSFLDVVLNLAEGDESSTLASQDTWLAQMKTKGTGKLVMYGDDTWLKLFPGTFDRVDGTTSFFVSDFTEVDHNVTRHVAGELKNDDWNTMVLHYLGLDHIGHKGGPRSPHMLPKQQEMDSIVKQIYTAIETEPHLNSTLLVVCGDHGMNDAGNHGASSPGETSPALVFLSPKLKALQTSSQAPMPDVDDFQYYTAVEQSDIAPTLAALLGFPVPKNNLGAFIPQFLPFWSNNDQFQLLMRNAQQMLDIITAAFGSQVLPGDSPASSCDDPQTEYEELACEWQNISKATRVTNAGDGVDPDWIYPMTKWLRKAQGIMSGMAGNYDVEKLFIGQAVAAVAVICAFAAAFTCVDDRAVSFIPFMGIVVLYGIMMFASSYVEEEHHFWYWATTAWFAILGLKGAKRGFTSRVSHGLATVLMVATTRLVRSWNRTGQKFAGEPDIVKMVLQTNPKLLWCLVSATYVWIHRELVYGFNGAPAPLGFVGATGLALAAFTFKAAFTYEDAPELVVDLVRSMLDMDFSRGATLISRARAVFFGLGVATACAVYFALAKKRLSLSSTATETIHHLYTLLAMTQSRTTNIPLFLLFHIQYKFLSAQDLSLIELSTSSLLLQYMAFFAFGGSNAISSVDLSNAYNGIAGYDPTAVGLLTFVSNWAGPIYWTSATTLVLLRKRKAGQRVVLRSHISLLTVFTTCSVAAVMAACTVLRTHLFIWTVFSPKYLYCIAWSLGQHLVVNIGVACLLFWLGT